MFPRKGLWIEYEIAVNHKNGRDHAVNVRALKPEEQQAELAWLSHDKGEDVATCTTDGPVKMGEEMNTPTRGTEFAVAIWPWTARGAKCVF